jgi:hypothetical protein
MADRRLIYFTATRVVLYRWGHGRLAAEASFANSEDGAAAFAAQLRASPGTLFYVLVDIVEEDFHQENVPFVRGGDRRTLLGRKLAQRYRDTSLALTLSLGYEKTQRRDERILFSSFTNNAQFQPWLQALRDKEAAVVGVYSVALLAPRLAARIGPKKAPVLLVTLQQAGLRQSYVEGGCIRFSRLGPMDAADAADPNRVAEAFDRETTRVYQYLTAMRVVAREGNAIDAVLVAPQGEKRRVQAAAPNMPQVRIGVIELGEAAAAIGLKEFPDGSGAEALYLHLLAQRAPAQQYAGEGLRQFFRLHQLRAGLVAGGAALGALALVFAGVQLVQVYNLGEQTALDRSRANASTEQYNRVTAGFPKLPTSTDNLRATMDKYGALAKQASPPERLLAEVSRALDATPRIEVDKVHWELATVDPKERIRQTEPARARAGAALGPVTGGAAPAGAPAPGQGLYEVADVTGKVLAVKASDYRAITQAIEEFMGNLRKRPGLEVIAAKMPVETSSGSRLSGDIGAEAGEGKVPQFTVVVSRRLGQ